MGQKNQKYTTAESIMQRISRKHKLKDMHIDDIAEWCSTCIIEIVGDPVSMYPYKKVKCIVTNNKALLPCNVYRLLDVYNLNDTRITNYSNDGAHIIFVHNQYFNVDKHGNKYVYINYHGIPVDPNTGYPLIKRGYELACEAYCVYNLYLEDFINQKIPMGIWQSIEQEKTLQCTAAGNGFREYTNDDMKKFMNIYMNIVPSAKQIPLFHLDSID